jgi:nucleotide-binding universal stress UspA family protein
MEGIVAEGQRSTIVVGVDGSIPSIEALKWAFGQAVLTGAALRVVTAWNFPNEPTPFGIVPEVPTPPDQLDRVEERLREVVAQVVGSSTGLEVETEVIRGRDGSVLVEAARDAELLVVGSRGRSALAEVLLGSVSEYCVRHARCPVVVFRGPTRHS